jgi:hypothetical protein
VPGSGVGSSTRGASATDTVTGRAGTGGGATGLTGGGGGSTLAGSWNQLCRQLAQRTVRPSPPIALSGTR